VESDELERTTLVGGLTFSVGGYVFNWDHLADLPNAARLVEIAVKSAKGYSMPGSYLNGGVRQFLEYVHEHKLTIDSSSVNSFRSRLEHGLQGANTKYDCFCRVRGFVGRLQQASLVAYFRLPKNLPREASKQKSSLYEIAPVHLEDMTEEQRHRANQISAKSGLDPLGSCAVAVAQLRLEAIRRYAQIEIEHVYRDFRTAEEAARHCSRFKGLDFESASGSREDLVGWMIHWHGRLLPSSDRMTRQLRDSIVALFGGLREMQAFLGPTADSLAPFIALCLADPLCCPNVDDVWNYTFRDCILQGDSSSTAILRFGKLRGSESEYAVELSRGKGSEWSVCHALQFLHEYTGACSHLLNERAKYVDGRVRLFVHLDRISTKSLKPLDPGTVVHALRRFLIRAAESEPEIRPIAQLATGENFRPTHALVVSSQEGIFAAKRRLRHKSIVTTQKYTERGVVRSARHIRMVAYQDFLLSQALSSQKAAAPAAPTGLGLHCSVGSGESPPVESGCHCESSCWRPDNCDSGCPAAVLVLEDVETVSIWMRMKAYLDAMGPQMKIDYPEKWSMWEIRLVWYEALLAKTSSRVRRLAEAYCETSDWSPPALH
jgi:hypothetical protein